MDFFIWGYIQDTLRNESLESFFDFRPRITMVITAVLEDVLSRVWSEVEFRFDVYTAVAGAHTEQH
jgi:hypothetical protein